MSIENSLDSIKIQVPYFCEICGDLIHKEQLIISSEKTYHIECLIRKVIGEVLKDIVNGTWDAWGDDFERPRKEGGVCEGVDRRTEPRSST